MSEHNIAIQTQGLSKSYNLYDNPGDVIWEFFTRRPQHQEFWALRDISFTIPRGQVVGIMGENGAGKSTLLKILSGTLSKTAGEVIVNGRISSILELGTGFNELSTGRENVHLSAMMMGMNRSEIKDKIDWIIDFSELRRVIDQPFRTYSTGMKARLTFATAICIEPEILIVDEALSVGDARFQQKSFGQIKRFREAGNTILLVSHDQNLLSKFCDHVILLEHGRLIDQGTPFRIVKSYYERIIKQRDLQIIDREAEKRIERPIEATTTATPSESYQTRMGNGDAEITSYGLRNEPGEETRLLTPGEHYLLYLTAHFHKQVDYLSIGFLIRDQQGVTLFGTSSETHRQHIDPPAPGTEIEVTCDIEMNLISGTYFLTYSVGGRDEYGNDVQHDMLYDALQFEVDCPPGTFTMSIVHMKPQLTVQSSTVDIPQESMP